MSTVLDELSREDELDRGDIEKRIVDWKARISGLYDRIERWLPPGFAADRVGTVPMREKLMGRYDVPDTVLPILNVSKNGRGIAKVVPGGLWIIGANGRLDLHVGEDHYLIVDRAENFHPADWTMAPARARRETTSLTAEVFRAAIGS